MGTDIHMYMEAKVNGQWTMICPDSCVLNGVTIAKAHRKWLTGIDPVTALARGQSITYSDGLIDSIFVGRNYYLFALLASVRGESKLGLKPRDLPDDCSASWRGMKKRQTGWAHNFSWLGGAEVFKFLHLYFVGMENCANALSDLLTTADAVCENLSLPRGDFRYVYFFDN
jgi:hypothetical protein